MFTPEWHQTLSDATDDLSILVYADRLDETETGDEHYSRNVEFAAILREWINIKTSVRIPFITVQVKEAFISRVEQYNDKYVQDRKITKALDGKVISLAIAGYDLGNAYTFLRTTPDYLSKRPNLLSAEPFRELWLMHRQDSSRENLKQVFTNWRLEKLWVLTLSYFKDERDIIDIVRIMKPLKACKVFSLQGVRDNHGKISSAILASKKFSKGCKITVADKIHVQS